MDSNIGLLKTQDLIGKPIISLQGEEVGSVSRIIADSENGRIVGLTVNVKGWFKGEKAIEFESVKSFGNYAVTVELGSHIVTLDSLPSLKKISEESNLYNMRIITPEGQLVGTIDDFFFDTTTGKIEKFILTGGIIKNLFKGRAAIPATSIQIVGKDAIIAISNVEETIQKDEAGIQDNIEQLKDDLGHWKGDLEHWKDDFEKLWDKTRTKAMELSKNVGENIKGAAATGTDKGKELISKTSEIISEKRETLRKSYDQWMNRLQNVKNKPATPLSQDEVNSLLGLKAAKTVTTNDGTVIIEQNTEVSQDTISKAQDAGKTKELLLSVATKDLEEQMESLKTEAEKLQDETDI